MLRRCFAFADRKVLELVVITQMHTSDTNMIAYRYCYLSFMASCF